MTGNEMFTPEQSQRVKSRLKGLTLSQKTKLGIRNDRQIEDMNVADLHLTIRHINAMIDLGDVEFKSMPASDWGNA
jgi:hypothetical protein